MKTAYEVIPTFRPGDRVSTHPDRVNGGWFLHHVDSSGDLIEGEDPIRVQTCELKDVDFMIDSRPDMPGGWAEGTLEEINVTDQVGGDPIYYKHKLNQFEDGQGKKVTHANHVLFSGQAGFRLASRREGERWGWIRG